MSGIKVEAGKIVKRIDEVREKSRIAIQMFAVQGAKKFENYAKKNRRWTDRTGHARQRLTGSVDVKVHKVTIYISHGVDYGVYLELAHNMKYAILEETVEQVSTEILEGCRTLLRYI